MLLERQQKGIVSNVYDLREFNGQCGKGVYFHKAYDKPMRKYYQQNGEQSCFAKINDSLVMDCSRKKVDYNYAKWIIYNNPDKAAFIFKHKGIGIPTSIQIVVTDVSKLELIKNI